ncbi:MAG: aminotransferase class V-fold PLP-dependent enzyme [Bacteroidota bacterium]
MKNKIHELEKVARLLETSPEQRADWATQFAAHAEQFISGLPTNPAYFYDSQEGKALNETPIGEQNQGLDTLLRTYRTHVEQTGINPASAKHFGYIPGGGIALSANADYLAAITNRYAGMYFANPGAVRIENQVIRWMCDLIGYGAQSFGNLTSGGSIANLVAVIAAREAKEIRSKIVDQSVVYLTRQVHHCVLKALRIAGLQECIVRKIPMDANFRMKTELLEQQIKSDLSMGLRPFLAVASAGSTDVGVVDPLEAIATICEAYQLWFHVDGAYGGAFLLADVPQADGSNVKDLFKGIARADSVTLDPHKGFFLPYGLGAILVKDINTLYHAHHQSANYLQDAEGLQEYSPSDLSPELTKHFRGLRMWMPLQHYGVAPFKAALEEKVYLTRYFFKKVQALGFEVGPYPDLSIAIYRFVPKSADANDFNEKLVRHIWKDGRFFVSSTSISGNYWIRMCILSFRTHLKEIDDFLSLLEQYLSAVYEEAEAVAV